jgi:hypothetical protein
MVALNHQADRNEIPERIVRRVGAQVRVDGRHAGRREIERVAVRFRFRHVLGSQRPIGAGAVFHQHGLAKLIAQLVGEDPRHEIGGTAGREADDEPDRAGRVALRRRDAGRHAEAKAGCKDDGTEKGYRAQG